MSKLNLSIDQAVKNAAVLHDKNVVFITDDQGNLDSISYFNFFGRLINFIKELIEGNGDHKVNQAALATFEKILQYAKTHQAQPIWTYSYEVDGKDFDIGFDKVAMRVLEDRSRFGAFYYKSPENGNDDTLVKMRKAAYQVLLMATMQRAKAKIDFDCDHLPRNG